MTEQRQYDWAEFLYDIRRTLDLKQYRYFERMVALLDEADADDVFGTEGWKHRVGLED